jgi:hypothetical protein
MNSARLWLVLFTILSVIVLRAYGQGTLVKADQLEAFIGTWPLTMANPN